MKKLLTLLMVFVLALSLSGCQNAPVAPAATAEPTAAPTAVPTEAPAMSRYSDYVLGTFDTAMTLIGFAESQEAFDHVMDLLEGRLVELHKEFDKYNAYSGVNNLYVLNAEAAKGPVVVSKDMMALLKQLKEWQARFPNTTNIAMGSVLALWHDVRETATYDPENLVLPTMEALQAANEHTNFDHVILDEEAMTVTYTDPELQLDLGAVAKGYAAERVAQEILYPLLPSFIFKPSYPTHVMADADFDNHYNSASTS